jgi:hypothetical protein
MRNRWVWTLLVGLAVLAPASAAAQANVPDTEMAAAGVDVGLWLPTEDALETGATLSALLEYYLTPRTSVRGTFGWADPSFAGENESLRQYRLAMDLQYNWERGKWHPFVGAGVGVYFVQHRENDADLGESRNEPGLGLGGGIEYFTTRTLAVKGEARYHLVKGEPDPSGLALTIGLKKYF